VKQTYHHGDLRRALLGAAAEVIDERGPAALSLRDLARRAGVSHAAPTHHFGDKAGLLTALAAEGYDMLAADLAEEWAATHSFLEQGVAYVRFAVRHRAHFEVMFRPDLYHADDPELVAARDRAGHALYAGIGAGPAPAAAASVGQAVPVGEAVSATSAAPVGQTASAAHAMSAAPAPAAAARQTAPAAETTTATTAGSGGAALEEVAASQGSPGERQPADVRAAGLAGWSIAHGFATLWVSGAFPDLPGDPDEIARAVLGRLPPPSDPR
jgi:AcrR family transcriptional regulator